MRAKFREVLQKDAENDEKASTPPRRRKAKGSKPGRSKASGSRSRRGSNPFSDYGKNKRKYRVTVYPSRFATNEPEAWDVTWRELVELCTDPNERETIEAPEKDSLRLWHGARLQEGGGRRNADVESVSCLFLDIDQGGLTPAVAELKRREIRAIAFASPSGKKGRGRIIIPLKREATPDEYKAVWTIVNGWLGGVVDKQTRSPSHGYYVPAIVRGKKFWHHEVKGRALDIDEMDLVFEENTAPIMRAPSQEEIDDLDLPWRRAQVQEFVNELGRRGDVTAGDRHGTLFKICQRCLDFALPEDHIEEIVLGFNAEHCNPPKDDEVVRQSVLANPERYRKNPVGCEATICVKIVRDHAAVLDRISRILAERCTNLYVQGGQLVELLFDKSGREKLVPVKQDRASTLISQHVRLYRFEPGKPDKGVPPTWVPSPVKGNDWIPKELCSMPSYPGMREIEGVTSAATLRADGSVLCTEGYDPQTMTYFHGDSVDIPDAPTFEEGRAALRRVAKIFAQFPLDAAGRSAHLALLLTAVARPYIDGPVPVALFDANQKQSGKSLLAQSVCIVMTGRVGDRTDWVYRDEMMMDKLHACASTDGRVIFFDNVRSGATLDSPVLDGALTTQRVSRRGHHMHTNIVLPFRHIVLITGNGFVVGGDLGPRSIYIRLETDRENPEERDDLKVKNLIGFLKKNRTKIIRDLLTAWRAWIAAGKPGEASTWMTVPDWAPVRKMLQWYGYKDPKETRNRVRRDDVEAKTKRLMIKLISENWPPEEGARGQKKRGGASASRILQRIEPRKIGGLAAKNPNEEHQELYYALSSLAKGNEKQLTPAGLGDVLRRFDRSVVGNLRLYKVTIKGITYWTVRSVEKET